jgi:hypothetical protein
MRTPKLVIYFFYLFGGESYYSYGPMIFLFFFTPWYLSLNILYIHEHWSTVVVFFLSPMLNNAVHGHGHGAKSL